MNDWEAMRDQQERMAPETGFRLVGLDDFEPGGSQLYRIGDFATRAEAEAAMAKIIAERKHNSDEMFIYTAEEH